VSNRTSRSAPPSLQPTQTLTLTLYSTTATDAAFGPATPAGRIAALAIGATRSRQRNPPPSSPRQSPASSFVPCATVASRDFARTMA